MTAASEFDCPPFVGALIADDVVIGSAFFCYLPRLLVTCAHSLKPGIKELWWKQFNGELVELTRWRILVCDADIDLAVIAIPLAVALRGAVAEMPRDPARRGIEVYFNAVGQFLGESGIEYLFDAGSGSLVGEHMPSKGLRRLKMQSSHVTPGCSGAPVLHYSGIGATVVGMISGRYNSPNWNRDTVWLVPADELKYALHVAQGLLLAEGLCGDPLAIIRSEFATKEFLSFVQNAQLSTRPHEASANSISNSFISQSENQSYVSDLRAFRDRPGSEPTTP